MAGKLVAKTDIVRHKDEALFLAGGVGEKVEIRSAPMNRHGGCTKKRRKSGTCKTKRGAKKRAAAKSSGGWGSERKYVRATKRTAKRGAKKGAKRTAKRGAKKSAKRGAKKGAKRGAKKSAKRGFAGMTKAKRSAIAAKGGRAAQRAKRNKGVRARNTARKADNRARGYITGTGRKPR